MTNQEVASFIINDFESKLAFMCEDPNHWRLPPAKDVLIECVAVALSSKDESIKELEHKLQIAKTALEHYAADSTYDQVVGCIFPTEAQEALKAIETKL